MTPERFRDCLEIIGWSQGRLHVRLGVGDTTVRGWAKGKCRVPPEVAHWLEMLVEAYEHTPPPKLKLYNPAIKD